MQHTYTTVLNIFFCGDDFPKFSYVYLFPFTNSGIMSIVVHVYVSVISK